MYQVYMTTNTTDNRYYIGVHKGDIYEDDYYGSGKYLRNSIRKNGKEIFDREVLSEFDNPDLAYFFETCLVGDETVEDKQCYNITNGGGNPPTFSGENHYLFGKKRKEKTLKKISKALKERYKDPKNREKISKSLLGNTPWNKGKSGIYSEETIKKMRDAKVGVKQSKEHVMAMAKSKIGHEVREETRRKIAETKFKPVIQIDMNGKEVAEYKSRKEAYEVTGIKSNYITACINGYQHTAGGYKWKNKTQEHES